MKCGCCGKDLGEFAFDKSYQMPDEIWDLDDDEFEERVKIDSDLGRLDDRYFIRGVAFFPVQLTDKKFGWGIWAEVTKEKFFEYVENFDHDNTASKPFKGKVANRLPQYQESLGLTLTVQLGSETERPIFTITDVSHELAIEQINGITLEKVHEFNKKS
jgi:hypothetical protein